MTPSPTINSKNNVSISLTAVGPWTEIGAAPWEPRSAAAITGSPDFTHVIMASGVTFEKGVAMAPTFGDGELERREKYVYINFFIS